MIKIIVKCTIKAGEEAEFIRLAKLLAERARQEEGCVAYQVGQDTRDGSVISLIEEWENTDLLGLHLKQAYYKEITDQMVVLEEKPTEFTFYNVVG